MNLIEGGRPRIGCIRLQPSAGSLILSLGEGHPSMGKIAGSSGKRGRTSGIGPAASGTARTPSPRPEHLSPGSCGPPIREQVDQSESQSLLEEPKQQHVTVVERVGNILEAW